MVTKKPKGLGLGLEALLGPRVEAPDAEADRLPSDLPLDRLRPGRYQPRTHMDEGSLYELAESIRSQGIMQPILVRPLDDGDYEVIAGERRLRAARLAGLERVPVLVRAVPDESAAVMALIENIQRENLNPLEEAQGLQRLVSDFALTHEQAAQAVGRSRSAASNLLRLLQLAEPVQQMLMAGDLDMGHARALLALSAAPQILAAQTIASRKLSVREAERLVARAVSTSTAGSGVPEPVAAARSRDIVRLEERLADHLTAPVEIRMRRARGRARTGSAPAASAGEVVIRFESLVALEALLGRLGLAET